MFEVIIKGILYYNDLPWWMLTLISERCVTELRLKNNFSTLKKKSFGLFHICFDLEFRKYLKKGNVDKIYECCV